MIPAMGIFVYAIGGLVWATAVHAGHDLLVVALPAAGVAGFAVWVWWEWTADDVPRTGEAGMNPFVWFGMMVGGPVLAVAGVLHGGPALALSACGAALFGIGTAKLVLWEPHARRDGNHSNRAVDRGIFTIYRTNTPITTLNAARTIWSSCLKQFSLSHLNTIP